MDNSDILRQIAYRSDNPTLILLSSIPSIRRILRPELENQFFWYKRADSHFNLPEGFHWKNNELENWHQVYNILLSTKERHPFSGRSNHVLTDNEYNLFTIKLLLKLGFNPAIEGSSALQAALLDGTPEVVQLLLSDPRIDIEKDPHNTWEHTLVSITEENNVKMMKVVLSEKRITDLIEDRNLLEAMIRSAIEYDIAEVLELLLDHKKDTSVDDLYKMAKSAIRRDNTKIITLLHKRGLDLSNTDLLKLAIENDQVESLLLLNSFLDNKLTNSQLMILAGDNLKESVAYELLKDKTIPVEIVSEAIRNATRIGQSSPLRVLLNDSRTSQLKDQLAKLLREEFLTDNTRKTILRSKYLDTSKLGNITLDAVIRDYSNEDALEGAYMFSGIRFSMSATIDFNKSHFEMLVREIVLKKLKLEYYIDWITEHLARENTRRALRNLFSAAADSVLSSEPVVHTSDIFTAYSGFLLLANSKSRDVRAIINTLEQEEGVTEKGLLLARILLGAFIGAEYLKLQERMYYS